MCRPIYDNLPNVLLKQIEIMEKQVIFDVLNNVRFNVLGNVRLVTPSDFSKMGSINKDELYDQMFDAWCSTCEALTALMTIENNYKQLQSK